MTDQSGKKVLRKFQEVMETENPLFSSTERAVTHSSIQSSVKAEWSAMEAASHARRAGQYMVWAWVAVVLCFVTVIFFWATPL